MGLTISYRGTLRNPNELESILEDVSDVCLEIGWAYMPIHRSDIMPAKGLMIMPAGSEPIWFTFLLNGNMYNPSHFIYTTRPEQEVINEEKHQRIFTKTRYAGMDTHMAIIKLFWYLSKLYFQDFELHDPSQYWETNDPSCCLSHFGESNEVLNKVGDSFGMDDDMDDDDDESEADRMDEALLGRGGFGINLN